MIPNQTIEEIRNKADIVTVVSEYVKLRKTGKNYVGLCPFHSEKKPSFTVSQEKQLFHCFGCGEGGNVFAFLMKIENLSFAEAAQELGKKLGIAVENISSGLKNQKDKVYEIIQMATQYYQNFLIGEGGEIARKYLKERGIDENTQKIFTLGYAPPAWDYLFKYLISRGVKPELIEQAGLVLPRERKGDYYDRFRNRLLFPICDPRGRPLAFSGRALGEEEPKYLNSPDTSLYHKGETLFGIHLSKDHIKKEKTAVLVEGNFDLISCYQAGVTNITASLGTALTSFQCKLLSRLCETVILALDADSAGAAAAERSAELLKEQGLKVKVADLGMHKDPDEMLKSAGRAALQKVLTEALPWLEFKIKRVLSRYNLLEIESRAKALREVAALLSQEKDPFIQKEYIKLAAELLKTNPEGITSEVKRASFYTGKSQATPHPAAKPSSKLVEAERTLIALACQSSKAREILKKALKSQDFNLPQSRVIAEILFSAEFEPEQDVAHFILDKVTQEDIKKFLTQILLSEHLTQTKKPETVLSDCLSVLKAESRRTILENLRHEIKEAEKVGNQEKVAELLQTLNKVKFPRIPADNKIEGEELNV